MVAFEEDLQNIAESTEMAQSVLDLFRLEDYKCLCSPGVLARLCPNLEHLLGFGFNLTTCNDTISLDNRQLGLGQLQSLQVEQYESPPDQADSRLSLVNILRETTRGLEAAQKLCYLSIQGLDRVDESLGFQLSHVSDLLLREFMGSAASLGRLLDMLPSLRRFHCQTLYYICHFPAPEFVAGNPAPICHVFELREYLDVAMARVPELE